MDVRCCFRPGFYFPPFPLLFDFIEICYDDLQCCYNYLFPPIVSVVVVFVAVTSPFSFVASVVVSWEAPLLAVFMVRFIDLFHVTRMFIH